MKSVRGEVVSSKPISLEKAAKSMCRFASAENGASNAVSVYLTRAAKALRELAQLHADLKSSHDSERIRGSGREKHKKRKHSVVGELGCSGHPVNCTENELEELEHLKKSNKDVSYGDGRQIKKRRKRASPD